MSDIARRVTEAKAPNLAIELQTVRPQIEAALPAGFPGGADRFLRIVLTAVRLAPDLAKCTPISVIGAAMQAAQLGLTPGALGEAWIIPYKNNKSGIYEASFQIGWRGMVALAGRSGMSVTGAIVYERDAFDYELGLEPRLYHKPGRGERGGSIYWYAIVRDKETRALVGFAVLDRAQVERRRSFSRSPNSPAWRDWFDEMALGKAAREALRFAPLTVELSVALASEETVRSNLEASAEELGEAWEPAYPEALETEQASPEQAPSES